MANAFTADDSDAASVASDHSAVLIGSDESDSEIIDVESLAQPTAIAAPQVRRTVVECCSIATGNILVFCVLCTPCAREVLNNLFGTQKRKPQRKRTQLLDE